MKGIEIIKRFIQFPDIINYLESKEDFYQAWNECERGDWMIWIAAQLKVKFELMVKANAMCALIVRHLMTDESINYCETALLFADGKVSLKKLNDEYNAAYDVYQSNHLILFNSRSNSDIIHNSAIYAASYSAINITDMSYYTASAIAYAVNAISISGRKQKETSDICREILTNEVFKLWDKKLKL